jgi:hypothetical protein
MANEAFKEFVCDLQRCCVGDLIKHEEVDQFIKDGLLESIEDWQELRYETSKILCHSCENRRCLMRCENKDGQTFYKCKVIHPVKDKVDPIADEYQPLPYWFTEHCEKTLIRLGLYIPPCEEYPKGRINHKMLDARRHIGSTHPGARERMSPCHPDFFAFTRSMQNLQIVTGTNGVTRYVVKVCRMRYDCWFKFVIQK